MARRKLSWTYGVYVFTFGSRPTIPLATFRNPIVVSPQSQVCFFPRLNVLDMVLCYKVSFSSSNEASISTV